ncbi:MAG: PBP1A family penicillin-binding protein [Acidobacteriota bacterium]|nr:PBP1A family penicillin-binding protein [Acidobacteriota bacterium]
MPIWLRRAVAAFYVLLVIGSAVVVVWTMRQTFAIHRLRRGVGDTVFLSADGRPWFRMDERRRDVPIADIAEDLRDAVIAIEDHRFRRHFGLDPIGISRAAMRNVTSASREGGSTITQQLARTLFLSNRQTWARKIQEAGLSILIELQLSKEQIFELYLNRIYLSGGMYGVEATSQALYGKPSKALALPEAALIAGLIKAPSALSPWSNFDEAHARSLLVLARMRELGFITEEDETRAARARIRIRPYPRAAEARHGYAKDYLRQTFRDRFGGDHPPDWTVQTTFMPELQDAAERAVAQGLQRVGRRGLEAALVAIDPRTGDVLAMVGGHDYGETPFNRAVRSHRQPGSAFKPFVFAAALERGWSPVSTLDGLSAIEPQGPEEWQPRNVSYSPDKITLRQALYESNNRAASVLQQRIGTRTVLGMARDVGLEEQPDVPSLALGAGLVTPIDLTAAYAPFANGGEAVTPRAIMRVTDGGGDVVLRTAVERTRVVSPETAFQMFTMLEDVVDRGTASGARSLGVRFVTGGKTGTTNEYKDAWFVGFSSSLVVGVWVGLDQPATIGPSASGARMALPIWADFMRRAARYRRPEPFDPPASLRQIALCRESFLQPMAQCPRYTEFFKEGDDVPGTQCPLHTGTIEERVERAVEGFFKGLGRRIKGVFR